MLRFTRDKRIIPVSFNDFMQAARTLNSIVVHGHPTATMEITVRERHRQNHPHVSKISDQTCDGDSVERKYKIDEFNAEVWNRSYWAEMSASDEQDKPPLMVTMRHSKGEKPQSIVFYAQNIGEKMEEEICDTLAKSSLLYTISDGYR